MQLNRLSTFPPEKADRTQNSPLWRNPQCCTPESTADQLAWTGFTNSVQFLLFCFFKESAKFENFYCLFFSAVFRTCRVCKNLPTRNSNWVEIAFARWIRADSGFLRIVKKVWSLRSLIIFVGVVFWGWKIFWKIHFFVFVFENCFVFYYFANFVFFQF